MFIFASTLNHANLLVTIVACTQCSLLALTVLLFHMYCFCRLSLTWTCGCGRNRRRTDKATIEDRFLPTVLKTTLIMNTMRLTFSNNTPTTGRHYLIIMQQMYNYGRRRLVSLFADLLRTNQELLRSTKLCRAANNATLATGNQRFHHHAWGYASAFDRCR